MPRNDLSLGSFCPVFGASLLAILYPLRVKHAAQNVVAHTGQVLHPAATDHHHRVLLQIVALAGNVPDHLETVGQPNLRDFAKCRVGLLRRRRVDAGTHPTLLRTLLKRGHLLFRMLRDARFADELVDSRHRLLPHPAGLPPRCREGNRTGQFIPTRKTEERLPAAMRSAPARSRLTASRERCGQLSFSIWP